MNLLEAIKSGRPFRRESFNDDMWCHVGPGTDGCQEVVFMSGNPKFHPKVDDVTAEDWIVQEPTVTVTASKMKEVLTETFTFPNMKITGIDGRDFVSSIMCKLGLDGDTK